MRILDPNRKIDAIQRRYEKKYNDASKYSVKTGFISFEEKIWLTVRSLPDCELILEKTFDYHGKECNHEKN